MNHQLLVNLMRPRSNRIPIAKIAGGRVNCFYDHALAKTEIVQFQSSLKDAMLMSADFLGERVHVGQLKRRRWCLITHRATAKKPERFRHKDGLLIFREGHSFR